MFYNFGGEEIIWNKSAWTEDDTRYMLYTKRKFKLREKQFYLLVFPMSEYTSLLTMINEAVMYTDIAYAKLFHIFLGLAPMKSIKTSVIVEETHQ